MKRTMLPLALLLGAAAPLAGPFASVRSAWQEAREAKDPSVAAAAYDRALAASPANGRLLAMAIEAASDPVRRAGLLRRFVAIGGTADSAQADRMLVGITGLGRESLADALTANGRPLIGSQSFATISAEAPHIEAVAYDPKRNCLYLSSVAGQSLHAQCKGRLRKLTLPGDVGPVLGIAFDATADRLWFVSNDVFGKTDRRTGLFALDLEGGRLSYIDGSGVLGLGDVALGHSGEIFAADSESGAIYRARIGRSLEVVVAPGLLRSAQGMAPSADGRSLYVADYAYGLARIDLADGRLRAMGAAADIGLDGIDGLMRHGSDLIAIQNGWQPARVLRLKLSGDGDTVTAAEVIDRRHPAHEEPTQGTIVSDRLLYVANSQWPRYDEKGQLKTGMRQAPTTILAFPLGR